MAASIPSRFFSDKPEDAYICGRCKKGQLVPAAETFKKEEPSFSKDAHGHEAWDFEWIDLRFSFKLVCSNPKCGELAFASGTGQVDQRYDWRGEPEYFECFVIRSLFPAPYLTQVPENLPDNVREAMERSFSLYWVDSSAAANALRASLELLMDELRIPRTQKRQDGKDYRLNLHQRIEAAEQQKPELKELFLALKDVGNLGSHGGDVKDEDYSDAIEIFAHVITSLFQDDAQRVKELAQKLSAKMKGTLS